MASIYKCKNKEGKTCGWQAVIRATGYPIVCKQFEWKQEAEDWATSVEQQIRSGQSNNLPVMQLKKFTVMQRRSAMDMKRLRKAACSLITTS